MLRFIKYLSEVFHKRFLEADEIIHRELIQVLYQQAQTALLGVVTTATGIAVVFYNNIPTTTILVWLMAIYILSYVRHRSIKEFISLSKHAKNTLLWGRIFVFFAFLSGLTWGAASIIFFDVAHLPLFNILTLIIIAMSVGSLAALSAYPLSYYVFVIPAIVPMVWRYLSIGEYGYTIFGVLLFVFVFALFSFVRVNNRILRQSIVLRFENVDLISQLTEQKEKAETANRSKTKFLAAASHDLRQPLHAIGLFLGSLVNRVEREEHVVIVKKIQQTTSALNSLLDSLLDVSKLDAGVVEVDSHPFSLQFLFDTLKDEFEPYAEEKQLKINFMNTSVWVNSDYKIVERVIRNLISNAIAYTTVGGVVVGCRRNSGKLVIAIYDTGIGIHEDAMEEIFTEFHQLHNPERDRSKGLGLGLAIVKRMTHLLDMSLLTRSVSGQGSMFGLAIPESLIVTMGEELPDITISELNFDGKWVLVIDDEFDVRDSLTELLTSWDFNVVAVASGDEAVNVLTERGIHPDIVLADYRLRNRETGVDAMVKVQSLFASTTIPMIIITGDTAPARIKEANSSGYEIMHKPVFPEKLKLLLSKTL